MTLEKAIGIAVRSMTPHRPYHAQWFVTRKCNYRCKGCSVWQEQSIKESPTEDIVRGLDVLRELGVVEVVLSGGNPLLRKDIGEIIEYASRFFITTVYDNGSMAEEKIDALRNADFVAISMDSLDPAKNDYVRGVDGAWKKAMKAIEKLRVEGIQVSVAPTISQFNLYEIIDFTSYFLEREIPVWYSLYSFDPPQKTSQLFGIGEKKDEFVISDERGMVKLCDSLIGMKRKNSNVLMTTKVLEALKNLALTGKRTWKCRALQNFLVVDHLGRVAGCHLHNPVSSVFDLPRAWGSEKFAMLRELYSKCTQCTYICYVFYSMHGSVLSNLRIVQEHWKNARLLFKKKQQQAPSLR